MLIGSLLPAMLDSSSRFQAELVNTKVEKQIGEVSDVPIISARSDVEPIVTRRELWSYYCMFLFLLQVYRRLSDKDSKCTLMAITCVFANPLL